MAAFVPAAAFAQPQQSAAAPPPAVPMSDLDVVTTYFAPRQPMIAMFQNSCSTLFRRRLETFPDEIAIEREVPGIHDVMVKSIADHCLAHMEPMTDTLLDKVRARIASYLTPEEIRRFAANFRFAAEEMTAVQVKLRDGETAEAAARRGVAEVERDNARFNRVAQALSRAPGGTALLEKIAALSKLLETDQKTEWAPVMNPAITAAMNSARKAGNAFAVSKGHDPVYIVD